MRDLAGRTLAVACLLLSGAGTAGTVDTSDRADPAQRHEESPAATSTELERCLVRTVRAAPAERSVEDVRRWCELETADQRELNEHALRARLALEELVQLNPFVITPHRRNYLMFWSYWDDPEWNDPAQEEEKDLSRNEAKFQLSFKAPIATDFWDGFSFYGAFTLTAFWQVYNGELSRPFREINYEPELFISRRLDLKLGPLHNLLFSFGYWHESNGRDIPGSRSWDRLFVNYVFTLEDWYVSVKPWWRIPENASDDPTDPRRDDNPDIERYLGHFELNVARPMGSHVTELMLRNNLRSDNRGAAQISYTFPLNRRFKGIVQAFTGYGDSLITYDNYENRFSVGVLLTDHF